MAETPEMVRRVAEAIGAITGVGWDQYLDEARAAIEAMREPTPQMMTAGARAAEDTAHHGMGMQSMEAELVFAGLWSAGIDAALASPEEGREP